VQPGKSTSKKQQHHHKHTSPNRRDKRQKRAVGAAVGLTQSPVSEAHSPTPKQGPFDLLRDTYARPMEGSTDEDEDEDKEPPTVVMEERLLSIKSAKRELMQDFKQLQSDQRRSVRDKVREQRRELKAMQLNMLVEAKRSGAGGKAKKQQRVPRTCEYHHHQQHQQPLHSLNLPGQRYHKPPTRDPIKEKVGEKEKELGQQKTEQGRESNRDKKNTRVGKSDRKRREASPEPRGQLPQLPPIRQSPQQPPAPKRRPQQPQINAIVPPHMQFVAQPASEAKLFSIPDLDNSPPAPADQTRVSDSEDDLNMSGATEGHVTEDSDTNDTGADDCTDDEESIEWEGKALPERTAELEDDPAALMQNEVEQRATLWMKGVVKPEEVVELQLQLAQQQEELARQQEQLELARQQIEQNKAAEAFVQPAPAAPPLRASTAPAAILGAPLDEKSRYANTARRMLDLAGTLQLITSAFVDRCCVAATNGLDDSVRTGGCTKREAKATTAMAVRQRCELPPIPRRSSQIDYFNWLNNAESNESMGMVAASAAAAEVAAAAAATAKAVATAAEKVAAAASASAIAAAAAVAAAAAAAATAAAISFAAAADAADSAFAASVKAQAAAHLTATELAAAEAKAATAQTEAAAAEAKREQLEERRLQQFAELQRMSAAATAVQCAVRLLNARLSVDEVRIRRAEALAATRQAEAAAAAAKRAQLEERRLAQNAKLHALRTKRAALSEWHRQRDVAAMVVQCAVRIRRAKLEVIQRHLDIISRCTVEIRASTSVYDVEQKTQAYKLRAKSLAFLGRYAQAEADYLAAQERLPFDDEVSAGVQRMRQKLEEKKKPQAVADGNAEAVRLYQEAVAAKELKEQAALAASWAAAAAFAAAVSAKVAVKNSDDAAVAAVAVAMAKARKARTAANNPFKMVLQRPKSNEDLDKSVAATEAEAAAAVEAVRLEGDSVPTVPAPAVHQPNPRRAYSVTYRPGKIGLTFGRNEHGAIVVLKSSAQTAAYSVAVGDRIICVDDIELQPTMEVQDVLDIIRTAARPMVVTYEVCSSSAVETAARLQSLKSAAKMVAILQANASALKQAAREHKKTEPVEPVPECMCTIHYHTGKLGLSFGKNAHGSFVVLKSTEQTAAHKVAVGDRIISVSGVRLVHTMEIQQVLDIIRKCERPMTVEIELCSAPVDEIKLRLQEIQRADSLIKILHPAPGDGVMRKLEPGEDCTYKITYATGKLGLSFSKNVLGRFVVLKSTEQTAAQKVAVGDKIVAVNGARLTDTMGVREVLELIRKSPRPMAMELELCSSSFDETKQRLKTLKSAAAFLGLSLVVSATAATATATATAMEEDGPC
jgi:PDZ domain-containing secreted protein